MVKLKRDNKFVNEIKKNQTIAKKEKSVKWVGQTKMKSCANWEGHRECLNVKDFISVEKIKLIIEFCISWRKIVFFISLILT